MAVLDTYISAKMLQKLIKVLALAYKSSTDKRKNELIHIDDTFSDSRALAHYYIEPNCQQVNPADEIEDEAISTVQTNIFNTINNFLNREIVVRDGGANQMFVLADAGMGKTSLLMILRLTHLMSFWPKGYKCQLLKLGANTLEEIDKINDKSNTLLLLDSLDEDPQCKDGGTVQRLIDVLERSKTFKRVIITCRTQFFPQNKNIVDSVFNTIGKISFANFSCPLIYLSLFNDDQVESYLKVRYAKGLSNYFTFSDNPKVAKALSALRKTGSLQFRPFLLSHIEDILEAAENGANEYELYNALIDKWLDREVGKLREKYNKTVNKQDLLQVCIWLAETMYRAGSNSVSLDKIKQLCAQESSIHLLSVKAEKVVKGINELDIGTNSLLNLNSAGEFRFSHLSIREFILVYGVSEKLISGLKQPFVVSDKMRKFIPMASIKEPFHFVNAKKGFILNGFRMENVSQLYGRNLKNSEVDWGEFLSNFIQQDIHGYIAVIKIIISFLDNCPKQLDKEERLTLLKLIEQLSLGSLKGLEYENRITREDLQTIKIRDRKEISTFQVSRDRIEILTHRVNRDIIDASIKRVGRDRLEGATKLVSRDILEGSRKLVSRDILELQIIEEDITVIKVANLIMHGLEVESINLSMTQRKRHPYMQIRMLALVVDLLVELVVEQPDSRLIEKFVDILSKSPDK